MARPPSSGRPAPRRAPRREGERAGRRRALLASPGNGIAGKNPSNPEGALPRAAARWLPSPGPAPCPGSGSAGPGRRWAAGRALLPSECRGKPLRFFTSSQREPKVSHPCGEQNLSREAAYILRGIARSNVDCACRPGATAYRPAYVICPLDAQLASSRLHLFFLPAVPALLGLFLSRHFSTSETNHHG